MLSLLINASAFPLNRLNRTSSHNDGEDGEEYDLFCGAVAGGIAQFRRQPTIDSLSQ